MNALQQQEGTQILVAVDTRPNFGSNLDFRLEDTVAISYSNKRIVRVDGKEVGFMHVDYILAGSNIAKCVLNLHEEITPEMVIALDILFGDEFIKPGLSEDYCSADFYILVPENVTRVGQLRPHILLQKYAYALGVMAGSSDYAKNERSLFQTFALEGDVTQQYFLTVLNCTEVVPLEDVPSGSDTIVSWAGTNPYYYMNPDQMHVPTV